MEVHVRCVGMARLIEKLRDKEEDIANMRNFWRSVGLYLVKRSVSDSLAGNRPPMGPSGLRGRKNTGNAWKNWAKGDGTRYFPISES